VPAVERFAGEFPKTFPLFSLTNDGNAILREIDVAHPAAKNMIELSRTQDEECGDGTTSVIVLGTPSARISPYAQK
jgi:T-complex protein 1 subunit gamma